MLIRLNKFISDSGYCSRRMADELISKKKVNINGEVANLGDRVTLNDQVTIGGKLIQPLHSNEKFVIFFHKPKNVITSTWDAYGRTTVISFLESQLKKKFSKKQNTPTNIVSAKPTSTTNTSSPEILYQQANQILDHLSSYIPIGRLDLDTSGLILLTNEKNLSHQLIHPSKKIAKIYSVKIKKITRPNLKALNSGVTLTDGFFKLDQIKIAPTKNSNTTELMVTIHSGRNRILRRYFKAIGHPIQELKRETFADFSLEKLKLKEGEFIWSSSIDKPLDSVQLL